MFIIVRAVQTDNPQVDEAYFEIEVADADAETIAASVAGIAPEGYEWTATTSDTSRMADPLAGVGGEGDPDPI
jgi:hypothetical protein